MNSYVSAVDFVLKPYCVLRLAISFDLPVLLQARNRACAFMCISVYILLCIYCIARCRFLPSLEEFKNIQMNYNNPKGEINIMS